VSDQDRAARSRRYRQRQRDGRRVFLVEVDECDATSWLVHDRLLDTALADDPRAIGAALGEVIRRYCEGRR
jgi:hypothetical protein